MQRNVIQWVSNAIAPLLHWAIAIYSCPHVCFWVWWVGDNVRTMTSQTLKILQILYTLCSFRSMIRSITKMSVIKINSSQTAHKNMSLLWRHNGQGNVSNHQPHDCLLNRLFRRRSKKTSKLRVTGFCAGNSPGTGEFPAQMASNAENVSIWWRHHVRSTVGYR